MIHIGIDVKLILGIVCHDIFLGLTIRHNLAQEGIGKAAILNQLINFSGENSYSKDFCGEATM
ncbi:MAG: hypothetical protein FKGGLIKP_00808 [Sodalis sp. Fse]|nr:MAG: hypothetical protein FKGGLIKP_00808 [Sodalis sp. Fse]